MKTVYNLFYPEYKEFSGFQYKFDPDYDLDTAIFGNVVFWGNLRFML